MFWKLLNLAKKVIGVLKLCPGGWGCVGWGGVGVGLRHVKLQRFRPKMEKRLNEYGKAGDSFSKTQLDAK